MLLGSAPISRLATNLHLPSPQPECLGLYKLHSGPPLCKATSMYIGGAQVGVRPRFVVEVARLLPTICAPIS